MMTLSLESLISRNEILKNGRFGDKALTVKYMDEDFSNQRRASSFEIRAYSSFVV